MIFKSLLAQIAINFGLINLSPFLPLSFNFINASPSSLYSPTCYFSNSASAPQVNLCRRYKPTNSQTSAPSYEPIGTSKLSSLSFIQGWPSQNRKLLLHWRIIYSSALEITILLTDLPKFMAFFNSLGVMDG